jgi:hypothetical protein
MWAQCLCIKINCKPYKHNLIKALIKVMTTSKKLFFRNSYFYLVHKFYQQTLSDLLELIKLMQRLIAILENFLFSMFSYL